MDIYDGYSFRNLKKQLPIDEPSEILGQDLRKLLREYYQVQYTQSEEESKAFVDQYDNVVIWSRLFDSKSKSLMATTYTSGYTAKGDNSRGACFFPAHFPGRDGVTNVSYAKALAFVDHSTYLYRYGQTHVGAHWVGRSRDTSWKTASGVREMQTS